MLNRRDSFMSQQRGQGYGHTYPPLFWLFSSETSRKVVQYYRNIPPVIIHVKQWDCENLVQVVDSCIFIVF